MSTARAWDLVNYDYQNPIIPKEVIDTTRKPPVHYADLPTTFGQWTRVSEPEFKVKTGHWYVDVQCSCGTRYSHKVHVLVGGKTEKCYECGLKESAKRFENRQGKS